jgi:DNA-3-methyladenine glycosylase II
MPAPLTSGTLAEAARRLAMHDYDLAHIYHTLGPPPLWAREPGFSTLIHIILEQQVSLASARAAMDRLLAATSPLTPETFLTFDDRQLKDIGFSRQKAGYGRRLAQALLDGFDLAELEALDDASVRGELMKLKGIGEWSADIYLLMALRRPDIWPRGDLALVSAITEVKQIDHRPTLEEFQQLGEPWRPWRAVAARMLWQHYLSKR